jgi:hypothetical protein
MNTDTIIASLSLFVSLINLVAILFLSNSMFRLLINKEAETREPVAAKRDEGLVDVKQSMTYDPRFRG